MSYWATAKPDGAADDDMQTPGIYNRERQHHVSVLNRTSHRLIATMHLCLTLHNVDYN